jgi:putative phosphoribosyl transferase
MTRDRERPALLRDRAEAGRRLAAALTHLSPEEPVVLGLARGGVPVAFEVARALQAPLDVRVVRKVGAPGNPEYGLGAVVEGGERFLDHPRAREEGLTEADLEQTVRTELEEAARRAHAYRGERPRLSVRNRVVVLVDDGIATGGSAIAAIRSVRSEGARRVVVALGTGPPETVHRLEAEADEVVALLTPSSFYAVGQWYEEFAPVTDRDVVRLLARAAGSP